MNEFSQPETGSLDFKDDQAKRFDQSQWVRYSGMWFISQTRYLYWFKFLQHAERSPDHQVDWKQYDGWGGANVVLGTKFDEWWEERWKELFATKVKGEQPKFPLATQRPKPDGIRYALLIYENQHRGSNWEIAVWVQKQEEKKRYGVQSFFFADDTRNERGHLEVGAEDKMIIQSRVGRYKQAANRYLNNVCEGQFP